MKTKKLIYLFFLTAVLHFSCKKIIDIGPPKSSLAQEVVFQNDGQATAAVIGMYAAMASANNYASGSSVSVSFLTGLSADEFSGYNSNNIPFYENQLVPELSSTQNIYFQAYQSIYTSNAILEGLAASSGITPSLQKQLEGEALFVRAFAYFYLINLYGAVPLQLSTDYRITQIAPRTSPEIIYQQILTDLLLAESKLTDTYITAGKVRPNKSTVQALLARAYLYMQDWANAEKYASSVINKTTAYNLVALDAIFLANSSEAIWQLMPTANTNSQDGLLNIPGSFTTAPSALSLSSNFATTAFEPNDKRLSSWVKSYVVGGNTFYYANKYKVKSSATVTEYSMVIRLAELYLIRAEARINIGKIDIGVGDLNVLRDRARSAPTLSIPNPLPPLSISLSKTDALLAVERERRVELFSEWGHRWFDLKRTNRANSILSIIKTKWQSTDVLYPIPSNEINRNPNITQNQGY
jgi:hypothetical protein